MVAAKARIAWRCQNCGHEAPRWMGRCASCGEFGTYVEEVERPSATGAVRSVAKAVRLSEVVSDPMERTKVGVAELDRVLGGGLVRGSLVLLGGEPGIGKSTLLLQAASALAVDGQSVLYVCGEESVQQVAMRARRLGIESDSLMLVPEIDISSVEDMVQELSPSVLIVDSIQTAFDPELGGAPGSVGQVRACTARLVRIAKDRGVTTMIVGHVTKDGSIAGPRVLEHMVDTVLYFEGDKDNSFRVVRAVKNRFGSSSEIGVFEMSERGLLGVESPSELLLAERGVPVAGSAVMAAIDGSRPMLLEIQALVSVSYLPSPRRLATGIETSRLLQVLAVLERRCGLSFAGKDVIVAVGGGVRVVEPAVDVPLALALASALRDQPVPGDVLAFGEIGLTGHIRPAGMQDARTAEGARFGLDRVVASTRDRHSGHGGRGGYDELPDALRVLD
jgi:DNA repair protein RadA/Sms